MLALLKTLITFAAALREAKFIETMGFRTAKAEPEVVKEISVFKTSVRFENKSFEKTLKRVWQKQKHVYL